MAPITRIGNEMKLDEPGQDVEKERLKEACEQFEAIFMQYLLKSMRQTVVRAEEPGQARELYEAMMDESLAKEIAGHDNNGLSDLLYRQLLPALGEKSSEKS